MGRGIRFLSFVHVLSSEISRENVHALGAVVFYAQCPDSIKTSPQTLGGRQGDGHLQSDVLTVELGFYCTNPEPELRILSICCARSQRLVPGPGRSPGRTRGSRPGCRPGSDQSIRWGPGYGHPRLRQPLLDPTGRMQSVDILAGDPSAFTSSDRVEAAWWGRPQGRTQHSNLLRTERTS